MTDLAPQTYPTDAPMSDAQVNARLAQYGVKLRPPIGDPKQWPAGWLPGDEPMEVVCEGEEDPYAHVRVFDAAARVRFLDCLADSGNVAKAAARVGVSRETAYRARRRHADFARVWDAALVHARARAEAELTSRALEGVAVPGMVRGEHVATYRKHDARYLLANLARLDRRIEADPGAVARSEHFDELLAAIAGHAAPEDFAEAAPSSRSDVPPTREDYVAHARMAASKACDRRGSYEEEFAAMETAEREAAERFDAWKAQGNALVEAILEGPEHGASSEPEDSVTCVNTPSSPEREERE